MRLTIREKISGGLAAIVLIGLAAMLVINAGLDAVGRTVHELALKEHPFNAAAYEMEINLNGVGFAVAKYLVVRDADHRNVLAKDTSDFRRSQAEYVRLAATAEQRALGERMGRLFDEFAALGNDLLVRRDDQESRYRQMNQALAGLDLQASKLPGAASVQARLELATLRVRFAEHLRGPDAASLAALAGALRSAGARIEAMDGPPEHVRQLRESYDGAAQAGRQFMALGEQIALKQAAFASQRRAMDALLDDSVQPLALRSLELPRERAERATQRVLATMHYLIPAFLFGAALVAFLLGRFVMVPLRRLQRGTEAIAGGDLSHRVVNDSADEFGDLAERFNHMAAELQATTVSRRLLQESEGRLRQTVDDLHRQIAQREQVEQERSRLQADLRRSETMSAMGALTAGVAHEVRNPLFGISSTLDAMEARFAHLPETLPYVQVLHREVDRLGKLMNDLLEYGKPAALALAPIAIDEAIAPAITACAALAERMAVEVRFVRGAELPTVQIDRSRMTQVFQNLIENAIRHSPRGGVVSVDVEAVQAEAGGGGQALQCRVSDQGAGFEPDDLPHLFEPFFTRRRGGTGLGLSIVLRIVQSHGGSISAANVAAGVGADVAANMAGAEADEPPTGAVMTLCLPVSSSA